MPHSRIKLTLVGAGVLSLGLLFVLSSAVGRRVMVEAQTPTPARTDGRNVTIETKGPTYLVVGERKSRVAEHMYNFGSLNVPVRGKERVVIFEVRPVSYCEGPACFPCKPAVCPLPPPPPPPTPQPWLDAEAVSVGFVLNSGTPSAPGR
jgi:hypothetical protein